MARTSDAVSRPSVLRRALGLLLGLLLGLAPLAFVAAGPAVALPAARADTPSPPPTTPVDEPEAAPVDEPVDGGGRTLTWLALAGAGSLAVVAGAVVALAAQRRGDRDEPPGSASSGADRAPAAGSAAQEADPGGTEGPDRPLGDPGPSGDDAADEPEVRPRRGIYPAAFGDEPLGDERIDLNTFHLDDPLALDAVFRPRRAMHPIPDTSDEDTEPEDDSTWADWYLATGQSSRRGRRALPPEHDDEDPAPRRARP